MKGALVLGRLGGIEIKVHWTFSLLLIWVLFSTFKQGGDTAMALFNTVLVLVLFFCVVLHELGHSRMARRFGIQTRSITLLPIGGVASLERMPEKPNEELAVALAGPAVNVLIALLLLLVVPLGTYQGFTAAQWEQFFATPSLDAFLVYLLMANILLVLFNLIPAFPMDGGRVLRALLGFSFNRAKATDIAARLGQAVSFIFLILGLFFNPFLVIIAIFVFFGAYTENKMVQQDYQLRGHVIREALLTDITLLHPTDPLQKAIETILKGTEKDFIVSLDGKVVGLLLNKVILENASQPERPIEDLMVREYPVLEPDSGLKEAIQLMASHQQKFIPVLEGENLVGAISSENISEFILLKAGLQPATP
ncbi:MAG: site-2 protease family protein [Robiginitalea sp.]|nr:site-2 protease family protein [Robiginitalea sp.]